MKYTKLSNASLNNFRIIVKKALMLDKEESELFYKIPESTWESIFKTNFNSELSYAKKILSGNTENLTHTQTIMLDRIKENIDNFKLSTELLTNYIKDDKKVIFITDFDNDGSISQSVIFQLLKVLPEEKRKNIIVEYAREVGGNGNRGLTYELVDDIVKNNKMSKTDDFLVITADNGINSRAEQGKINKNFKNSKLLITDHHNPEEGMYIVENDQTVIFNPHYKMKDYASDEVLKDRKFRMNADKLENYQFFEKYNISGATTVGLLIKEYIKQNFNTSDLTLEEQIKLGDDATKDKEIKMIEELSRMSNMLDYVETHASDKPYDKKEIDNYLDLQSLLNVNNSVAKMITNLISEDSINVIKEKVEKSDSEEKLDIDTVVVENKKIMSINILAQALLSQYMDYLDLNDIQKNEWEDLSLKNNYVEKAIANVIDGSASIEDFKYQSDNKNYIEQMRPYIFELTVNNNKTQYEKTLLTGMLDLYQKLRISEKNIMKELRKTSIFDEIETENSTIIVIDKELQGIFNRKLSNKTYNKTNDGILITLDNISPNKISGSFRSLYDISEIFGKEKSKLEKKLKIKIETPGHEKAAGFIVTNKGKEDLSLDTVKEINNFLNNRIKDIKEKGLLLGNNDIELITDLQSIETINKINSVVRGNVAHFDRITPVVKLDKYTVYTNPRTGEQTKLSDIVKKQKYGYVQIQTKLGSAHRDPEVVLAPVGIVRKIVDSNFEDLLKVNYLNTGVFMGDGVVKESDIKNSIILEDNKKVTNQLIETFKDGKMDNAVKVSREEIQDNPFFKYNKFSHKDFRNFENTVISIIDSNKVDCYSIFDVEANGFGNAKLMNIGFMNYIADEDLENGITKLLHIDNFSKNILKTETNYLFLPQIKDSLITIDELVKNGTLKELTEEEYKANKKILLSTIFKSNNNKRYLMVDNNEESFKNNLLRVDNFLKKDDGTVLINRTIRAETIAFLVKPEKGFIIPNYMTKLTGISNELAHEYGLPINEIDKKLTDYFKDKRTLFQAHSTSYDGRIIRVNLPSFSKELESFKNLIADSAEFSKDLKLMYDNIEVLNFENVPGLKNYYFYNNKYSKLNFENFIKSDEEGEFPDIKNSIRIVKKLDSNSNSYNFYVKDLKTNVLNKIVITSLIVVDDNNVEVNMSLGEMLDEKDNSNFKKTKQPVITTSGLVSTHIGYKAQGLGEQKMIRQLLIDDEDFNINKIDDFSKYPELLEHKEKMIEFQNNYRFNKKPEENTYQFVTAYKLNNNFSDYKFASSFSSFVNDFIKKNSDIENKYNDTWYYKAVLSKYEPELYTDLNKDNYEIISEETGVREDLVKEVLEKAYKFKQKYKDQGCTNVIYNETHMNGPYKGNIVGDVAYEDKATLLLLIDRTSNYYANKISQVTNYFNMTQKKYQAKFIKQTKLSDDSAIDSMSFKQSKQYNDEANNTDTIKKMRERDQEILTNNSVNHLIKFKLSEKELQADKHVYAISKVGVDLTEDIINDDAKKIAKIVSCLQVSNGKDRIEEIYDYNYYDLLKNKDDLLTRYEYLEINNSIEMIGEFTKEVNKYVMSGVDVEKIFSHNLFSVPKKSNGKSGVDFVTKNQLEKVYDIVKFQLLSELSQEIDNKDDLKLVANAFESNNYVNNIDKSKNKFANSILEEMAFIQSIQNMSETDFEKTFDSKGIIGMNITPFDEIKEVNNSRINRIIESLYVVSAAIHKKILTPSRIETIFNLLENNVDIRAKLNKEHETIEDYLFLSKNHSIINRRSATKHLIEKMDYVDLSYKPIFENYIDNKKENELENNLENKEDVAVNKMKI